MPLAALASREALMAVSAAALIIAFRHMLHARFARTGGDGGTYLLFCPNFTLVALAATALLDYSATPQTGIWLMFCGLLVTLISILALPAVDRAGRVVKHP